MLFDIKIVSRNLSVMHKIFINGPETSQIYINIQPNEIVITNPDPNMWPGLMKRSLLLFNFSALRAYNLWSWEWYLHPIKQHYRRMSLKIQVGSYIIKLQA